jgi:hypothetical protein
MPCLTLDRLYDYLDGALPAGEKAEVDRHLADCPGCRSALEARRLLAEAAGNLPPFAVPDGFAAGIMARIPAAPMKKARRGPAWAVGGAAFTLAGFSLAVILSGQGVLSFLRKAGGAFGSYLEGALSLAAKGLKILTLAGKIIVTLSGQVLDTLRSIAEMIGPEGRAVVAGGALVIVITGGMFLRRRQTLSERPHDK